MDTTAAATSPAHTPTGSPGAEPRLCYVQDGAAWFTTCPLDEQWGDDWNDAPYQHNAGPPYLWRSTDKQPEYEVVQVEFTSPLSEPGDGVFDSGWSVQRINAGWWPWLQGPGLGTREWVAVMAGVTLEEFTRLVVSVGGTVGTPAVERSAW